jgi:hypothetical protein
MGLSWHIPKAIINGLKKMSISPLGAPTNLKKEKNNV